MSQKTRGRKDDPSRFVGEGVNFRAKLIGIDDVESARGDGMCQNSLYKLKAAVKASGEHKQRIVVNVSLEGLTLIDERTKAINHNHAVHRISFISRDVTDPRAFGYIFGVGDGTHKFFGIKTMQAAEFLVLTLRDLFQCVYELKKKEMEDVKSQNEGGDTTDNQTPAKEGENIYQVPTNAPVEQKEGENIYQSMALAEHINSQLENISPVTGIEQLNTFEEIFSATPAAGTGDSGTSKGDPWGAPSTETGDSTGFGDGFGTTTPANNNDPFDTAFSTPTTVQTSAPSGVDELMGFQSQTTTTMTTPFQNSFQTPVTGIPGFQQPAPGGFGPGFTSATTVNPLAGVPRPGFGQPTFGATPFGAGATPYGAAATPFGAAPRPFGAAATPFGTAAMPFGAAAAPFGAAPTPGGFGARQAAPNPFGPPPSVPSPAGDMFGGPILAPITSDNAFSNAKDVPGPRTAEDDSGKPRAGSDLFGDLCEIGPVKSKGKSPKELFDEEKSTPKKSLSQLQHESVPPAPTPQPAPGPQQASDDTNLTSSFSSSSGSSNDFPETPDPFDSFPFHNPSSSFPIEPTPTPLLAANGIKPATPGRPAPNGHFPSQTSLFSIGVEDFNLPSPKGPPPPLPSIGSVPVRAAPPPPPPRPGSDSSLKSLPRPKVAQVNGTASKRDPVGNNDTWTATWQESAPQVPVNGVTLTNDRMNMKNDAWTAAWQEPVQQVPQFKTPTLTTNCIKTSDAWSARKQDTSAVINFAVSDPFDDPFFTDSDSFSSFQTVISTNGHAKTSTEEIKSLSAIHSHNNSGTQKTSPVPLPPDPFGDSFSIFGVPPLGANQDEPLYATVNKTKPSEQFDLL